MTTISTPQTLTNLRQRVVRLLTLTMVGLALALSAATAVAAPAPVGLTECDQAGCTIVTNSDAANYAKLRAKVLASPHPVGMPFGPRLLP